MSNTDFDPDAYLKANASPQGDQSSGDFNPDAYLKANAPPKEDNTSPTFLGTMADTLTAAPKAIYQQGKEALTDLWEKEKADAAQNQKNPSGVFTDWADKGGDLASLAAAPLAPVTNTIGAGVKAAAQPIATGLAGASMIPEVFGAKGPSYEEAYEHFYPEVQTALGLIIPKGFKGSSITPPAIPPAPTRGPLTLTTGEASGDLPQIQREQSVIRGERGAIAQRATVPFQEQRAQEIEDLQNRVADSLGTAGGPQTPADAGNVVSTHLRNLEQQRNAGITQNEAALHADQEAIRASLSPTGQVLARNPQEAADIVSAGITRAEEQATTVRDAAYEDFTSKPGQFKPEAFGDVANQVRRGLNDPNNRFMLNETTPRTAQAIDLIQNELDEPARIAADPKTTSYTPITPASVDNVRKGLVQLSRQAASTARATGNSSDIAGISRVMDTFDDAVASALKSKKTFTGDGKDAAQAQAAARASHAKLRQDFYPQGGGDTVGPIMNKIVGQREGQAAPASDIDRWTTGSGGISELVGRRLHSVLGRNSPEIGAIKQSLWSKAVDRPEGMEPFTAVQKADNIDKLRSSPLARVHFSPQELERMGQHAANLRASAAPSTDPLDRVIGKITGRDTGLPMTDAEVRNILYSRSVPYDNAERVALARRLMNTLPPEGQAVLSKGLFRHLIEPGGDMKDWGPAKVRERIMKFLDVDGKAMSNTVWMPEQREIVRAYGNLMGKLEIPKTGANWPGTTGALLRAVGTKVGMAAATIVGEILHPGIYSALISPAVGWGVGKLGELNEARWIKKQLPLFANKMDKWNKAVAAAQRTGLPPYKTLAAAAFNEASRAASQLGINLTGIVGAAAQEENDKKLRPQDQKRNGGAVNPQNRARGGVIDNSSRTKPKFHPVIAGARLAPDGHYYLHDATRPGKFLRVVKHG